MRIKKLEIVGFKTFPERTELHFHEGINAIVGPNGCGKSNVIDAVRWVLGETSAKGLRGDSMGDVIFSGTVSRRGMNLAEVTLTLSQAEGQLPERFGTFHEVAVTRRLHRSGESEYLINRIPCRLKDITELFMDTGVGRRAYSVVEQGRIDAILSAKPQDRRTLIEEAAGITKYKSRKDEAWRKMEETSQNLARLGDVLGEVRRDMNALRRQAARAAEFKGLRQERRRLERDLLVAAWLGLLAERDVGLDRARTQECEAVEARVRADRLGACLEGARLELLEQERELETRQRQVYHTRGEITQRESRTEFLRREAASAGERREAALQEREELGARVAALGAESDAAAAELAAVEQRLLVTAAGESELAEGCRAATAALGEAEKNVELQRSAHQKVVGDLTRVGHALDHNARQEGEGRRRLDGMARQEVDAAAKLRELDEELALREQELVAAGQARESALQARTVADAGCKEGRSRRHGLAARVEQARKELLTDQSRLKGLEQIKDSLEGYGAGVKAVLKEAKQAGSSGVHGVVADAVSAPAEYESALEAALGERLQYVVVESLGHALEGVHHLKRQKAGRSSFAPLTLRPGFPPVFPSASEPGARGCLLELVEVAPEYRPLAQCLLGDVFVVDTLESALRFWESGGLRATLVTLEGETVTPEGVVTGGSGRQEGGGLLRKNREIRELRAGVERRRAELAALEASLAALDEELDDWQQRFEAAREDVHRQDLLVAHAGRDLAQLRERKERLDERREALEFEREDLTARHLALSAETAQLEQEKLRLFALQEDTQGLLDAGRRGAEQARGQLHDVQGRLTELRIEGAAARQRREGLAERLRTLGASRENGERRLERLEREAAEALGVREERTREVADVERQLDVLRRELGKEEEGLSAGSQALDGRRGELGDDERAAAQARREAEEGQRRLADAQLALRDLELQAETLRQRFSERQQADVEREAESGLPCDFDASWAEGRIRDLDGQLAAFGEINLLAIEEYEERKTRHSFLEGQKADLEQSLDALKQAIQRINRVSRERFGETFEKVNRTFQELYPKMFRGGEARLVLTDPDNLLASGIDIVARPPGKRPQHISLLSGGEKALTAAALIFSIFLVKPSPFCILDEVDAPLDEANIGRFTEMVRTMAATSQFLVITHNKSTMEAADHLYGITMSEPGVSKVVSVRLADDRPAEAA